MKFLPIYQVILAIAFFLDKLEKFFDWLRYYILEAYKYFVHVYNGVRGKRILHIFKYWIQFLLNIHYLIMEVGQDSYTIILCRLLFQSINIVWGVLHTQYRMYCGTQPVHGSYPLNVNYIQKPIRSMVCWYHEGLQKIARPLYYVYKSVLITKVNENKETNPW